QPLIARRSLLEAVSPQAAKPLLQLARAPIARRAPPGGRNCGCDRVVARKMSIQPAPRLLGCAPPVFVASAQPPSNGMRKQHSFDPIATFHDIIAVSLAQKSATQRFTEPRDREQQLGPQQTVMRPCIGSP